MSFLDVVKWNASDNETIAMKFVTPRHDDQFNTGSRLIVSTGQEAVVLINGEMTGPFKPNPRGYSMDTKNLPILTNFIKKHVFFGETPYPAEVWFVQVASAPDFGWGTQDPVELGIPYQSNGMALEFTAGITLYGTMELAIVDTKKFMARMVQTKPVFTRSDLRSAMNAKLMQVLKPTLARLLRSNGVSIRDIIFSQDVIAKATYEAFADQVKGYGLELLSLNVESVRLTPETAERVKKLDLKAMDVAGESLERTTLGLSRKEEKQLDIMGKMASNKGYGETMAPAMGMGMGLGMAGKFAADMMKIANGATAPASAPPANTLNSVPLQSVSPQPPPPPVQKPVQYYLFLNGQQVGPYSLNQIKDAVRNAGFVLTPETLAWHEGMSEWTPCARLIEFADCLVNPSSPPPPPPNAN